MQTNATACESNKPRGARIARYRQSAMAVPDPDTDSRSEYDAWHSGFPAGSVADAPWHRLLLPHVQRHVPGADVLEIGCGRGEYGLELWRLGPRSLMCADFSPVAVMKTSDLLALQGASDAKTSVEDIERMSFPNACFDVVVCCETIEHVPDPERAIRELSRVLRPHGTLLLSAPNYLSLHGAYRAYLRMSGRRFTELGQPINNFVMAPRTSRWLKRAGMRVEHRLGAGLYLPVPRTAGPVPVRLTPRVRRCLRPFLLHSAFVARKDAALIRSTAERAGVKSPTLRVLRVADVSGRSLGGASRAMKATSAHLVERGHTVDLRFSEDMPSLGPRSCRRILVPLLVLFHVVGLVRKGDAPDVVEIHEPLGAPYALLRALTLRRQLPPMVAFSHGLEERAWRAQRVRWRITGRRGPLKSKLLVPLTLVAPAKIALRLADHVVVLSTDDRDYLLRKRGMNAARVHRVDNGVEDEILTLHRSPSSAAASTSILFVGSWIDRKGTPELAQAFAGVSRSHPGTRLVVAGAGCEPTAVQAHFPESVRRSVDVRPTVSRSELQGLLAQADIFVLPSWFEGMPLSLLEAAAAGLPVVVTDICGMRDVIRPSDPESDGGRLVEPHSVESLQSTLGELLAAPALREKLGVCARARAQSFTWSRATDALERVYRDSVRNS